MKSMGSINCLVTDIIQNIFLCVCVFSMRKKFIQVRNNLRVRK